MNWLKEMVQIIVGIWVASIATIALSTWKCQIKAHKHIEFLDELTDTIHDFILSMSEPIAYLGFAKIEIDCFTGIHNQDEDIKNPEAVAFIKKSGKCYSDKVRKSLSAVRMTVSKMKALVAKGQILGIDNYSQCQEACSMLEWSYNQIEVFCYIIGNQSLNWRNPKVQETLNKALLVNHEDINNNLTQQNVEFISFAKQAYNAVYHNNILSAILRKMKIWSHV